MAHTQTLISQAYAAFNRRDIDAALALMSENVSWPKASEGGRASGKEEIRAYWTRQWKQFDPHVDPIEVIDREAGITDVKVHQLVKSLAGDVLSDSEVWHVYTIANGLIERMDLKPTEATSNPSPLRRLLPTLARFLRQTGQFFESFCHRKYANFSRATNFSPPITYWDRLLRMIRPVFFSVLLLITASAIASAQNATATPAAPSPNDLGRVHSVLPCPALLLSR